MRICISNLALYNAGYNLWTWLELPAVEEEIQEAFVKIKLGRFNAAGEYEHGYADGFEFYEEFHIVDWEDVPPGVEVSRYANIEELSTEAEIWEGLKPHDQKIIEAIIEVRECDLTTALLESENVIVFHVDPNQTESNMYYDLGKEYLEETGGLYNVPEHLKNYIDFEEYGRDLGFTFASNGYAISDY